MFGVHTVIVLAGRPEVTDPAHHFPSLAKYPLHLSLDAEPTTTFRGWPKVRWRRADAIPSPTHIPFRGWPKVCWRRADAIVHAGSGHTYP